MISEPKLLPCPFCGYPAFDDNPEGDIEGYRMLCSGLHVFSNATADICPFHTFSYASHADAALAWNNRAPAIAQTVQPVSNDEIEAAVLAEREACAILCEARYMGDNTREDMEARRCAAMIRARTK